jgi:hypothetical protein
MGVLGEGSYGEVQHCTWRGANVAVKVSGVDIRGPGSLRREQALYEVLLVNPFPRVLPVLGVCSDSADGKVRLVMRMCEAGNLCDALKGFRAQVTRVLARCRNVRFVALTVLVRRHARWLWLGAATQLAPPPCVLCLGRAGPPWKPFWRLPTRW